MSQVRFQSFLIFRNETDGEGIIPVVDEFRGDKSAAGGKRYENTFRAVRCDGAGPVVALGADFYYFFSVSVPSGDSDAK